MKKKILSCLLVIVGLSLTAATDGFTFESFGNRVNSACAPAQPFTDDCMLCHTSGSKGDGTPAQTAYKQGGTALTDFFCPPVASCTDFDNDTYAIEGGDCGPVDCDDTDGAINPGATENCSDNIDNNCNGLVDTQDPVAVGCLVCTDSDADGFSAEGGDCGPVDCDDTDSAVNPGAEALFVKYSDAEIRRRFDQFLAKIPHVTGSNNHMGSRFTEDARALAPVMESLQEKGLFFIDSRTTGRSKVPEVAHRYGVPTMDRDVFFDNVAEVDAIVREIRHLEGKARKQGMAIGICHPYPETLEALRKELPGLVARGVTVVPVSVLLQKQSSAHGS